LQVKLGINLGFATNRYAEPEIWAKIVREDLGLTSVQFVADLLDPFLPDDYIDEQVSRITKAVTLYDLTVDSIFTSTYTRVNHLMHPDKRARDVWLGWFKKLFLIGSRFGCKTGGSHFGILTFDSFDNNYGYLVDEAVGNWQDLSFYAKELGYDSLIFEPMSVPREMGNTVAESEKLMEMVNAKCGIPLKVCLDIGHAPHPDERDPYPWIERLGHVSPIIHIQQTVLNKSNHSPFTEEYNKDGIIDGGKVMSALEKSGCEETILVFEIGHREHWDTDFRVIPDLAQSVSYWRKWVRE
jgi:sugar phosphate isomerase/epimerase